uniref:Uncharacterized protein n=1 Tax=Romanomermis culicivorax TaxID=13658 RepID=A0A915KW01_ROMCU
MIEAILEKPQEVGVHDHHKLSVLATIRANAQAEHQLNGETSHAKKQCIRRLISISDQLINKICQQKRCMLCFVCKQRGHPNQQNCNVQNCIEDGLPQPQMNIHDPGFNPTLPTIHSSPQHTLGTIMRAYHQCNNEEYVLNLPIHDWCNMWPPSPSKTDAIPKPLPTLLPDYKIPCKRPCPSSNQMTTFEQPQKKGRNILSLLHGLTNEPYNFHPQKTLLPTLK